jgi:hypothetical protein
MRQLRPRRERVYSPLRDKTLKSVLCHQFVTQFGFENKVPIAEAMIDRILNTIESFVQPHSLLKPGQMLWMAVRHDGRKHTFRSMKDTPQVPVILDLVTDDDLQALASGEDFLAVRRNRHARLLDQAFAQGGVLAQSDLSAITLVSDDRVGADVAHAKKTEGRPLPYRGSVQDLGPTLSHKVDVACLLEAGYLEPEICRKLSPVHDLRSVERYAQTYKNVLKLLDHGLAPQEISGILSLSNRLMSSYVEIVKEHHPDVLAANQHFRASVKHLDPLKGHKS